MAEQFLDIGADKPIALTVLDAAGSALDLSAYEGYAVVLYYEKDKTVIQSYSKNTVSGYDSDAIDTTNEATGVLVIEFQRALSVLGREGAQVYFQIQVQATDSDYASSQFRDLTAGTYCFTFRKGGITSTTDVS